MAAGVFYTAACASNSSSSARPAIPKAADCPGGRVVVIANPTNEGLDVLTPMWTDRQEVLGIVAARTTATFPLTTASSGRVQVRLSNPYIPESRRPDLRTVQVVVRCA